MDAHALRNWNAQLHNTLTKEAAPANAPPHYVLPVSRAPSQVVNANAKISAALLDLPKTLILANASRNEGHDSP